MPIRSRASTIQRAVQKNNNGTLTHAHSLDRSLAPAALLLGGLPLAVPSASAVPLDPGADEALLYYQRADGDYNGWGPHL